MGNTHGVIQRICSISKDHFLGPAAPFSREEEGHLNRLAGSAKGV